MVCSLRFNQSRILFRLFVFVLSSAIILYPLNAFSDCSGGSSSSSGSSGSSGTSNGYSYNSGSTCDDDSSSSSSGSSNSGSSASEGSCGGNEGIDSVVSSGGAGDAGSSSSCSNTTTSNESNTTDTNSSNGGVPVGGTTDSNSSGLTSCGNTSDVGSTGTQNYFASELAFAGDVLSYIGSGIVSGFSSAGQTATNISTAAGQAVSHIYTTIATNPQVVAAINATISFGIQINCFLFGDPVIVPTGEVVDSVEDFSIDINGKAFVIERKYRKSPLINSVVGNKWYLNLDTRIIRSNNPKTSEIVSLCQTNIAEIQNHINYLNQAIGVMQNFQYYNAQNEIAQSQSTVADLEGKKSEITSIYNTYNSDYKYEIENEKLNNFSSLNNAEFVKSVGNDKIVFIDDEGMPHIYTLTAARDIDSTTEYNDDIVNYYPDGSDTIKDRNTSPEIRLESNGDWILTNTDGSKRKYNQYGFPVELIDQNNNVTEISYDDNFKIDTIEDCYGREFEFDYNEKGELIRITDPAGRAVNYGYNVNGELETVTDKNGYSMKYEYTADGLLEKKIKNDGSIFGYQYAIIGGKNIVQKIINEEGKIAVQFEYNPEMKYTICTNDEGLNQKYYYNDQYLTTRIDYSDGSSEFFEYDDSFNQISFTDRIGRKTQMVYDDKNNLLRKIYPDSSFELWTYNNNNKPTFYKDRNGFCRHMFYSGANLISVNFEDNSNVSMEYDGNGLIKSFRNQDGGVKRFYYDENGYLSVLEDEEGGLFQYKYDITGSLKIFKDADENATTLTYTNDGLLTSVTDPLGNTEEYAYNSRDDLISEKNKNGYTFSYVYNKTHDRIKTIKPDGTTLNYSYNYDGKVLSVNTAGKDLVYYSYDADGRRIYEKNVVTGAEFFYKYDSAGQMTEVKDSLGYMTKYIYDVSGNVVEKINRDGKTSRYSYDKNGNMLSRTDENGKVTTYSRDIFGRITSVIFPDGSEKKYSYTPGGNPMLYTDARGYFTSMEYNSSGKIIRKSLPEGLSESFKYDYNGNVIERTDEKNLTYEYIYDEANRLLAEKLPTGVEKTYEYDAVGNVISHENEFGMNFSYQYDSMNRLTKEYLPSGASRSYTYDGFGNLSEMTDENGSLTKYFHDTFGRLLSVTDALGKTINYNYDIYNRLIRFNINGGKDYSYSYNPEGLLLSETNRLGVSKYYTYDNAGNVITEKDFNGNTKQYQYDALYRKTAEVFHDGTQNAYLYDNEGNIIRAVRSGIENSFSYDGLNRIVSTATTNYNSTYTVSNSYDSYGRLRERKSVYKNEQPKSTVYTYDDFSRLTEIQTGNTSNAFEYDTAGNMTKRIAGDGAVTVYGYNQLNLLETTITKDRHGRILDGFGYIYDKAGKIGAVLDNNGYLSTYEYDNTGRLSKAVYPFHRKHRYAVEERLYAGLNYRDKFNHGKGKKNNNDDDSMEFLRSADIDDFIEGLGETVADDDMNNTADNSSDESNISRLQDIYGSLVPHYKQNRRVKYFPEKYSYDANSNITKVSNPFGEIDHTYDDENRLLTKGQRNFAYDNNGNLVNESIEWNSKKYADTAYSYDPLNRMKSVSRYAGHGYVFKAEYDYDAFNRETSRFFGLEKLPSNENYGNAFKHGAAKYEITAKNSYYHDTTPEVSMETREWSFFGYPIVEKSETQYSGRRLLSRDTGRKAVYYTHDIHESITSAREGFFGFGVTQAVRYGAWGETLSDTFRFDRPENGYNGKAYDRFAMLYNFGYRHYSPFTRQWTSTDPVKDGFNWQTYLGGVADPMNFWDQWGLWIAATTDGKEQDYLKTNPSSLKGLNPFYQGNGEWAESPQCSGQFTLHFKDPYIYGNVTMVDSGFKDKDGKPIMAIKAQGVIVAYISKNEYFEKAYDGTITAIARSIYITIQNAQNSGKGGNGCPKK